MSVLHVLLSAGSVAALFVLFAWLQPANRECSGDCGACATGACPTEGGKS